MKYPPEYYASRPNLPRPVKETAAYDNPDRVPGAILAAPAHEVPTRSNNERFNTLLNSCQHPGAVYAALIAFARSELEVTV